MQITDRDFEELKDLFKTYIHVETLESNEDDELMEHLSEQLLARTKGKIYRKIYDCGKHGT